MVHPKEAIDQIGLVQQQIRFNSIIKLKKEILQEDLSNKIVELIQRFISNNSFYPELIMIKVSILFKRELDDDIGNILKNENNLSIDCVTIDIRKDYYDSQTKNKLQTDKKSDHFALVVSWSLEVKFLIDIYFLIFINDLILGNRTKNSEVIFVRS